MRGILKKELRQAFASVTAWVYLAVFTFVSGFYFVTGNLIRRDGDIKTFFSSMFTPALFLLPLLTMRLFSEEKRYRTEELLLTSPVRITDIILGKYLATFLLFLLGLLPAISFPFLLAMFGSPAFTEALCAFLGFILLCASFLAIGLFLSVLTSHQLTAAVSTYAVLLLFYFLDSPELIRNNRLLAAFVNMLSLRSHYMPVTYGILGMADTVYFLLLVSLFLFLSVYALERRRL